MNEIFENLALEIMIREIVISKLFRLVIIEKSESKLSNQQVEFDIDSMQGNLNEMSMKLKSGQLCTLNLSSGNLQIKKD